MSSKKQAIKAYKTKKQLREMRAKREALSRRHHPSRSRSRKGRGKSRSALKRAIEREVQKFKQRNQQAQANKQARNQRRPRREVARRPSETGWDFVRRLARKNPGTLFEVLPGLAVKYHGGLQSYFFYVRSTGGEWKPVESKLLLPPELLQ